MTAPQFPSYVGLIAETRNSTEPAVKLHIDINGNRHYVTLVEARKLHAELTKFFGQST